MAYEFKKLSEVEKIEELNDSASVLVEDGGEVKRVAKDKVGGGSGGYDMVIAASADIKYANEKSILSVESGTCADVMKAVKAGRNPKILLKYMKHWETDDEIYDDYQTLNAVYVMVEDTGDYGEINVEATFVLSDDTRKLVNFIVKIQDGPGWNNKIKGANFNGGTSWS